MSPRSRARGALWPLDRQDLTDLDWIPFGLGLNAILALRCAAIGDVRSLVDLTVLTLYGGVFAMFRFVYRLHGYGHNLDPDAPVKVKPFTPPFLGNNQIANFETWAGPQPGTYLVASFLVGAIGILLYHLVVGRRRELAAAAPPAGDPSKDEAA